MPLLRSFDPSLPLRFVSNQRLSSPGMPHFIATSWATRARPRAANDLLNACRANTPAYKQRRVQGSAFGAPALTSTKQQPLPGVQALLHVSEKQAGLPNQREHTTVAQRAGGVARLQVQMAPRVRSRTAPTPLAASRRNTFMFMLRDASAQVFSSKLFQEILAKKVHFGI